jgi:5'-3' exonuclease
VAAPLLVVDTPSMLYRAFYGLPKTIKGTIPGGAKKQPVNALLGCANLVLREVEQHKPRAVVLCFGPDAATYRVELYSGYHEQRPEMPPELVPQWADARGFFSAFGWTVTDHDSLEADDLLGSYAVKEAKAGGRTLVMTGDRDMFQCADPKTKILYVSTGTQGAVSMGPKEVKERYGIAPAQVPDFIALRGDPSDGLPGAKGVGEKTAAELLRKYGSLEKLLDDAIRIPKPALRTTLTGQRQELLDFKHIATLQDAKIGRPRDKRTDFRGAAKAARERGMNRLGERLEGLA